MKWFLIVLVSVVCSAGWVRGQDAAAILYKQGGDALSAEQYDVAAQTFDKILNGYPNTPNIDDVHLRAGFAYLHLGDFPNTIDRLSKETLPSANAAYRGTALYFTGLAQFSQGQKALQSQPPDKTASNKSMSDAAATFTTLIDYITANPTPDNTDFMEDSIYYRSLAQYTREDYKDAEKDLLLLVQKYPSSLKKPDYLLLLGSLYAVETNQLVDAYNDPKDTAPKTTDAIKAMADKAISTFDQVRNDPNALVQANNANMSRAEVLYLIAQIDAPSTEGYQKAIEAFRFVRRKDDMIDLQKIRLDQLKKMSQNALSGGNAAAGASMANENSRLIDREEGRLTELQNGSDPIIQALIRMAECYVSMKQPNEARTILHRLIGHAQLPPDLQQEVDFQLLYSYVLGGETDKANRALNDYLTKHAGDPQADSISYQIAAKLLERKDYDGALSQAQRSLRDFPKGRYVAQAIALEAQALTSLGRVKEAEQILDQYVKANPSNPAANQMLLTKAQGEAAQGDLDGALNDYKSVIDNKAASADLRAAAAAGHVQVLQLSQKYDDVITESNAFVTQYPDNAAIPGVMVYGALAMDRKGDSAGAVTAMQGVAKKYPTNDASPFALFYVVNVYQRANNVPAMIEAANDLSTAYPTAYTFISQAADAVSAEYVKEKKFDEAIALYQPLVAAPKLDVSESAHNKIGDIWLAAAKALGYYQSMSAAMRVDGLKRLSSAEEAYVTTLKNSPDPVDASVLKDAPGQLDAVGEAFDGLATALKQRRSWGLLTDSDMEAYLGKLTTDLTSHEIVTRVEMAKAGLVFINKNGEKQFPAALDRFKKAVASNPEMMLTRQESVQFGELLLSNKEYADALKVYTNLLANALPTDQMAQADGYYGLGATYLAQNDVAKAKDYFTKMQALPNNALWHPHIQDAQYGLALANEQSAQQADNDAARQTYSTLMQSPGAGIPLQAKAMIGYGRLLQKEGHGVSPAVPGSIEYAVHYFQEPHTLFGPAVPALSAEGLFDAGQSYESAGDKANAKKQYTDLITAYGQTAPDWAAKAQDAQAKLGP